MTGELLVGLDIGTTMTKAAVVRSDDGREVAWGRAPTPWRGSPAGPRAEAAEILDGALHALSSALEAAPAGHVAGVGVTSMAETVVLLGPDGRPMAPCIAWYDGNGEQEADQMGEVFGRGTFSRRTGLDVSSVCSLVKLAWLVRQGLPPPVRAMSIADWVVHMLGGEQASEASLASRTGALSLQDRAWWPEVLEWAGMPPGLLPPVVQAGHCSGRANAGPSRLAGAAVTCAGHDHLCGAAGAGVTRPDQVLDSCGTAEAFVRAVPPMDGDGVDRVLAAGINVGWHTLPGSYALMRGHSLGLLLERVAALVGANSPEAVAALDREAGSVGPGGLRVAQEGPFAPPSVHGLDESSSPAALWSAALAHVGQEASGVIRAMQDVAGPAAELVLTGGWAHCPGARRGRLHLLPRARWPHVAEAGARGAALFGGCAAGVFEGPAGFPVPEEQPWHLPSAGVAGPANFLPSQTT